MMEDELGADTGVKKQRRGRPRRRPHSSDTTRVGASPHKKARGQPSGADTPSKSKSPAAAKPNSRGESEPTQKPKGTPTKDKKRCLCCDRYAKTNGRFCLEEHNPVYDAMRYQAMQSKLPRIKGYPRGTTQLDLFNRRMASDAVAKDEIALFQQENPPGKRFARKGWVNFACFNQRLASSSSKVDGYRLEPFEKEQFILRQQNQYGRPRDIGIAMWHDAYRSGCTRDNEGYKGEERLWLPGGEWLDFLKTLSKSREVEQTTGQLKHVDESELAEWERNLQNHSVDTNASFLNRGSSFASAGPDEIQAESDGAG